MANKETGNGEWRMGNGKEVKKKKKNRFTHAIRVLLILSGNNQRPVQKKRQKALPKTQDNDAALKIKCEIISLP